MATRNAPIGQNFSSKEPKSISKSDDFVWNLPGLQKHGFYAAAYYLSKYEKNQIPKKARSTRSTANLKGPALATTK